MPKINFRAGENTGGGWEPLPEGDCLFEIEDVKLGTSKSDNPQIEVAMKIMDGPREGGTAKNWYSLLPKAGWNLRGLLEALDIPFETNGQDDEGRDDIVFDSDDLIGRQVIFLVKQRDWQGRTQNDFWNPRDPDAPEEEATDGKNAGAAADNAQTQQQAPQQGRRRPRPSR